MSNNGPPLKQEFLEEKIDLVLKEMGETGIDVWLTFSREGNEDPIASDLRFGNLTWRSAAMVDVNGNKTALVGSFEVETIKQRGFYDKIYGYGNEGAVPKIYELVKERKPKKIAVNISQDFGLADGLSSGMKDYLLRSLKEYSDRIVSAEDLIITLRAKLLPKEIEIVKRSIEKCEEIYRIAEEEGLIKVGKKDREIHNLIRREVKKMGLETAWEETMCPSVTIGTNPAGHVAYHNDVLEDGDFLRIDFGVRFEGYCSDIQRVYFVGNKSMPQDMKKMFDTARISNDAGISKLKQGVEGHVVDKACRDVVINSGYPEFMHATGHVLGRATHEIGPLLGPVWPDRYGKAVEKRVQANMVFTIEPSIEGPYGTCNIEQDVLVTENGVTPLSKGQQDIIHIT
jgi:Xaa-Pro aminopeptidase